MIKIHMSLIYMLTHHLVPQNVATDSIVLMKLKNYYLNKKWKARMRSNMNANQHKNGIIQMTNMRNITESTEEQEKHSSGEDMENLNDFHCYTKRKRNSATAYPNKRRRTIRPLGKESSQRTINRRIKEIFKNLKTILKDRWKDGVSCLLKLLMKEDKNIMIDWLRKCSWNYLNKNIPKKISS